VQEQAGDQAVAVAPLPRAGGMVPGPGVGGVPLQPADGFPGRFHQRVLELIGPRIQRRGLVPAAAVAGLAGGDPVGGVQDRDALDRADGQVEIRHRVRILAPLGRADLSKLHRAGVRVRGQVCRHRCRFPLVRLLGLAALDQEFPAGPDVLLVEALDRLRVDLAAQPERRGAFPGPPPRWLSGRGVVGHGPGAAAAALSGGEIGDVVAGVQRDVS
jgi:hypothetical protein